MQDLEKILKAFANRRRLAIVKFLKHRKEASVSEISREIGLSLKSTSRHLSVLFAVDILEKEQRSLQVFYRLSGNQKMVVRQLISFL